jgi:hypothetical protein
MSCRALVHRLLGRLTTFIVFSSCLTAGVATLACGQTAGWHSVAEANASALFGASAQTLTSFATTVSHDGVGFSGDATFKFRYGESEDQQRVRFVSSRSWAANVSLDATPKARFSPFVLGSLEASLEKRIASRSSGGAGAKFVIAKSNTGSASISAALLGEHTVALSDSAIAPTTVARWSWRAKVDQRVADRVSFSHTTFFAPAFRALAQYTVTSTSVAGIEMNKSLAFTLTFTDNYDSQAKSRGAPTNNDGSLLFGVRASF